MGWLQSIDDVGFRCLHEVWRHPILDVLTDLANSNWFIIPLVVFAVGCLLGKNRRRARVCVVLVVVAVLLGDALVGQTLKRAFHRPRPGVSASTSSASAPGSQSYSFPSSHAANWFAAATVLGFYYRRSIRWMLPLAVWVGFARIYRGAHYPTDVLAGALLGVGYAAAVLWAVDVVWRKLGARYFPLWWTPLPSLLRPEQSLVVRIPGAENQAPVVDSPELVRQYLTLGYLFIAALLIVRWGYLSGPAIQLSEDEAYQWVWSKHPALSYYSKPPLIAYTQWVGTALWGDTEFGVRFFSPLLAALLSLQLLRFFHREGSVRIGFWMILVSATTPLLAVGALLMTIDPLSVFFWTLAMVSGWRAVQQDSTWQWLATGLWIGLGCLSKYTGLIQWICWALFLATCPPARAQWRRPGPYLAIAITGLCLTPVVIWNALHQWITVTHVAQVGHLGRSWQPTLRYFLEFFFPEAGLLNPVFFVAALWAIVRFWKHPQRTALWDFCFWMGAPLFAGYLAFSFYSRVQLNWIAPAVVPLFCLMALYWQARWREGDLGVKRWLTVGILLGLPVVVLLHDTNLVAKITGWPLPPRLDPLRRVRAWSETARVVGEARAELLSEGKPVFIIGDHYGITGQISFYLPEARLGVPDQPLVYFQSSDVPLNQFFFWPGYRGRKSENAIYVLQTDQSRMAPESVRREFATVQDLGMRDILYRGRVFRRIQLFACRDLH